MIGFESFSLSSWIDNGLTRHIETAKRKKIAVKRDIKKVSLALIILGSNILPSSAFATQTATMKLQPSIEHVKYHSKLGDLVPDGYWKDLISDMQTWETLPEPDFEYPDID